MFTGIVKTVGVVEKTSLKKKIKVVEILAKNLKLSLGESVSINGVCATVIKKARNRFVVQFMHETLSKTKASRLKAGDRVNLEDSLKYGDKISGHFVLGHVEGVGKVVKIDRDSKTIDVTVVVPNEILKYVIYKGSITIEGVSLTVSNKTKKNFGVSLIPYTLKNTNLKNLNIGDLVNIETDIIAKYLSNKIK